MTADEYLARPLGERIERLRHAMLAMDAPMILTFGARPEDLRRWGIPEGALHPDWTASLAGHDDNHLDQLARALDGRP